MDGMEGGGLVGFLTVLIMVVKIFGILLENFDLYRLDPIRRSEVFFFNVFFTFFCCLGRVGSCV